MESHRNAEVSEATAGSNGHQPHKVSGMHGDQRDIGF
jgi:hypothetical protein